MPESRPRKKANYTPPSSKTPERFGGGRWVAPAMVTFWLVGLLWIVVYYIAPNTRYLVDLGGWNLAIGMVLIAGGFVLSTKWE